MIVVSFGAGDNSTAMLTNLALRGERVDLILFADTIAEQPHVYAHVSAFSEWLVAHGMPPVVTVKRTNRAGAVRGIEADCIAGKMLPSIAYGYKSCSIKYKRDPQDKFCNNYQPCIDAWARGEKVVKLIGYDMDEPERAHIAEDAKYTYRYPLIEWNWGRDECIAAMTDAGIKPPGKSACFFCPSNKKHEVLELRRRYPALADRAVAIESNAELTDVKGLGRRFAWGDLYAADDAQAKLFPETPVAMGCGCYDGAPA